MVEGSSLLPHTAQESSVFEGSGLSPRELPDLHADKGREQEATSSLPCMRSVPVQKDGGFKSERSSEPWKMGSLQARTCRVKRGGEPAQRRKGRRSTRSVRQRPQDQGKRAGGHPKDGQKGGPRPQRRREGQGARGAQELAGR